MCNQDHRQPQITITIGDPAGIGPEVVLKALADPAMTATAQIQLVGSRRWLERTFQHLSQQPDIGPLVHPKELLVLDVPLAVESERQMAVGQESAASGEASFQYLELAIAQALRGQCQAVVTAPIAKSAWKAAGRLYPGQTELLAERSGVARYGMLFVARSPHTGWTMRTLLATTHIPLRQVPDALNPALMTHKLELLIDCLQQDFGLLAPRIAVAGLNPHSGEQGQLGTEEQDWLIPWLRAMGDRFPSVTLKGPVPPDTLWIEAAQSWYGSDRGLHQAADAYLALYHDQGLIPVKLLAFDRAVNTSIGLPFIRTSPDHGTAFDIAGQGKADPSSMKAAIALAVELSRNRLLVGH